MSDLYTSLSVSLKKKRYLLELDDESPFTSKKHRTAPPTPPATVCKQTGPLAVTLPANLSRLHTIQIALQHALSHALATCAVSPSDTGIVRNVLNHYSLTTYSGLTTKFDINDLSRLCWMWEWDGESLPENKPSTTNDDPFLDDKPPPPPKDWTRGSMGLVISPCTHFLKTVGKRVHAYGIGVEVEMDIDKGIDGGMAAVARWTADSEKRRAECLRKLERWAELHGDSIPIPNIPKADLPPLFAPASTSKVPAPVRELVFASPKGISSLALAPPTSLSRSPTKSPVKRSAAEREFAIPFLVTSPSKTAFGGKNSLAFPRTPSSRNRVNPTSGLLTPTTPSTLEFASEPSTPVHQEGENASTAPQTPSTSRRQALYDRIRQKSLASTPSKPARSRVMSGKQTKDQILKMEQEEMRRRCLLGRLGDVAQSVWMRFSSPVGSCTIPSARKRRTLPKSEVALAVVKSSPVPISFAEAHESLGLLTSLCPFFLKDMNIEGEEWLEMPTPITAPSADIDGPSAIDSPRKPVAPPSPGPTRGKHESADEVHTRSPRRVERGGGLRVVREIIRKELESQD